MDEILASITAECDRYGLTDQYHHNLRRRFVVTCMGGENYILRTWRFSSLAKALSVLDDLFDAGFGVSLDVN